MKAIACRDVGKKARKQLEIKSKKKQKNKKTSLIQKDSGDQIQEVFPTSVSLSYTNMCGTNVGYFSCLYFPLSFCIRLYSVLGFNLYFISVLFLRLSLHAMFFLQKYIYN